MSDIRHLGVPGLRASPGDNHHLHQRLEDLQATVASAHDAGRLQVGLKAALELALWGRPLKTVLDHLAALGTELLDGRTVVMVANPAGTHLQFMAASGFTPAFCEAVNNLPIDPEQLSCGRATAIRERVVAPDVLVASHWRPFLHLASEYDIRACCSTPIIRRDGKVLGSYAVVHSTPHEPRDGELQTIDLLAHTAAILIERHQSEQDRQAAEAAVQESERRFRALVQASSDVVYSLSPDWSEMRSVVGQGFVADTSEPMRGWIDKYIHPDDHATVMAAVEQAIREKSVFDLRHRVIRVDGTLGWTHSRAVPLLNGDGEVTDWIGAASDVTATVEAEEQLKSLAAERAELARRNEMIAQEMSHRVMNSFAAMESMFVTQSRMVADAQARQVLGQAEARIRSMAIVHRQLFQFTRDDVGSIPVRRYLEGLVDELAQAFVVGGKCLIAVDADDVELSVARATTVGLVATELVINACKHAFPPGCDEGRVHVRLHRIGGGLLRFVVEDDGVGMPLGQSPAASTGLGMRLVRSFTGQLSGTLEVDGPPGCRFTIQFPTA